jgi:hypothetical protein
MSDTAAAVKGADAPHTLESLHDHIMKLEAWVERLFTHTGVEKPALRTDAPATDAAISEPSATGDAPLPASPEASHTPPDPAASVPPASSAEKPPAS